MKTLKPKMALLAVFTFPFLVHAGTVHALRDGWRLQSACTVKADGAAISAAGFAVNDWIKTTVPSTVLAAQAASKLFADPYYGMNLRNIPGTGYPIGHNFAELPMPQDSPYHCGWWYRVEFSAPAASMRDERAWLHFGGINYRGEVWVNGKRIADSTTVAGAYRIYDFDVTDAIKPGAENVLAVETFAPTEKDLGINWVDWNPCPPDKDMGLWGEVNLVTTGDRHAAIADGGHAFSRSLTGDRRPDRLCRVAQRDGKRSEGRCIWVGGGDSYRAAGAACGA